MKMSVGEKATLTMTPDFGYGARGAGGVIPVSPACRFSAPPHDSHCSLSVQPNADLKFEVELIKIN